MPRRRGLRPRLLAAVVRSNATLAFAAERQIVGQTRRLMTKNPLVDIAERHVQRALAEFVGRTGLDPVARHEIIGSELRRALLSQDAGAIDTALLLAVRFKLLTADLAPLLAELLLVPWHQKHEDIALALQRLRVPATIDALARAAVIKHSYLAYNDSHALARKCTWALADIGTPEARAHLENLAGVDDAEIASYAQKRLDNWDDELGRKGSVSVV
jgi:hypothetical protein